MQTSCTFSHSVKNDVRNKFNFSLYNVGACSLVSRLGKKIPVPPYPSSQDVTLMFKIV